MPLRGGGVGPLMANAILNFHFDFLTPSLMEEVLVSTKDIMTKFMIDSGSLWTTIKLSFCPASWQQMGWGKEKNGYSRRQDWRGQRETSGRWKIWQRWRIQSYQSSSGPMTAQAPIRMERCQFSIWKCGWEKKLVNSKYASSHTGNAWHHLTELYRKNIIESALAASDKKVLEDRFGLKPLYRSHDWKKSQVISTEGALRLPTTYDNHPIQPNPSHCYFGCSWGFEELHWKVEFLNTFLGF